MEYFEQLSSETGMVVEVVKERLEPRHAGHNSEESTHNARDVMGGIKRMTARTRTPLRG